MKRWIVIFVAVALVLWGANATYRAMAVNPAGMALPELGVAAGESFIYGYPLVLMDVTRARMFEQQSADEELYNRFLHVRGLPGVGDDQVVRPNVDTLYSLAWLDLSEGPVVMRWPDMADRYWVFQVLDAWTDVAATPGSRTMGQSAGGVVITGPDDTDPGIEGLDHVAVDTRMAWVIGRIEIGGNNGLTKAKKLQDQVTLPRESRDFVPAGEGAVRPPELVAAMDAEAFFARLTTLMEHNPPGDQLDEAMRKRLHAIGFDHDLTRYSTADFGRLARRALDRGVNGAHRLLEQATSVQPLTHGADNWRKSSDDLGDYETNYELRAAVALRGLGATIPQETVYPHTRVDNMGIPLHGRDAYRLRFAPGELPPVHAFWSLTLYDSEGYLVETGTGRHAISSREALHYDDDGGLTLHIAADPPPDLPASNWLPAPEGAAFTLTARLYWPEQAAISGEWRMPELQMMGAPAEGRYMSQKGVAD